MSKGALIPVLQGLPEADGAPMYLLLYRRIRDAILSGALAPGQRLPAGRALAADLGVSRTTVEAALGQLHAHGFVERRVGAGTFVRAGAPANPRVPRRFAAGSPAAEPVRGRAALALPALSARGRVLAAPLPASAGARDLACFPADTWSRIAARHARRGTPGPAAGDPCGYRPLRESVAAHVATTRGVKCDWRQVLVVAGIGQGLDLLGRILLDPGDAVWMEEPGYPVARSILLAAGARVCPVRVDGDGMDVDHGERTAPDARMACVTPGRHYPLGVPLGRARREALLGWAERTGAWIFEDDHGSELRYDGRPHAALQALDPSGRVVHAGTFNPLLVPPVRLAYLVLPPGLVEPAARALERTHGPISPFHQAVLAEFIDEGHLAVHLRQLRRLFRESRDACLAAVARHAEGLLRCGPADGGPHLVLHLPGSVDDVEISRRAAEQGLDLPALSPHFAGPQSASGLLLRFRSAAPGELDRAVRAVAEMLEPRAAACA